MKSWSRNSKKQEPESAVGPSSTKRISDKNVSVPVWVSHTPTQENLSDEDTSSTGRTSSTPPYAEKEHSDHRTSLKQRLKALLPASWRLHGETKESNSEAGSFQILPNGTRVSPPVSPFLERRHWDNVDGGSSQNSHKPLLRDSPTDDLLHPVPQEESLLTSIHPAEYYAEKVEVYKQKYSYLKSWPGLLRLLAGLELLFGGMVFACVIAYIQKDNEWSNSYGLYNGIYNNGYGPSGYSYSGPMTPFILAVAGISWIITLLLLVMGMTMYYRTILLDASWWPLTEAAINLVLFLLYMATGIVYLNDLNRGGLCYMTIGINPVMANLCRVDGGQMAGTAFIFINMTMYLTSFLVCLKMWRHEATRREREYFQNRVQDKSSEPQEQHHRSIPLTSIKPKRISFRDDMDASAEKRAINQHTLRAADPQHVPKVQVIADYTMKYPDISSVEEREKYKAVFNDQYQEYKDLHNDINTTLSKFRELDAMMVKLLQGGKSQEDRRRIESVLQKYEQKKSDAGFREKKERCDYLKAKLSHIKNKIKTFDQDTMGIDRT